MKYKLNCKAITGYDCKFTVDTDNAFDAQGTMRAHIQYDHDEQNAKRDMEEVVVFDTTMQAMINEQE